MEIYVKISFHFHILSFFLVFKHDFIRCVDYTRIAASNIASHKLGHIEYLIQTYYILMLIL